MGLKSILLYGLVFAACAAHADRSSCLPEFMSLQAMRPVVLTANESGQFALKSENAGGVFESKARLSYSLENGVLRLRFHFDESFGGVSLPYNLYSVLILQNGAVAVWHDFTKQCRGLGPGLFPGQSFSLPPLKLEGEGPQTLQIMVWGRLN